MIGGEVAPPWRMDSESTVKFTMLPNWQTQPWMDAWVHAGAVECKCLTK